MNHQPLARPFAVSQSTLSPRQATEPISRIYRPNRFISLVLAAIATGLTVPRMFAQTYTVTDLGTLGGRFSFATGINDSGLVVGYSETNSGNFRAFAYSLGAMTDLGSLGGDTGSSYASSVNNSGLIVGSSAPTPESNTVVNAVSFSGGVINDLGSLGGRASEAYGVNNSGLIVGESLPATPNSNYHAFSELGGVMTDLGTLGGISSTALAVNSSGLIVGGSDTTENNGEHAISDSGGVMTDLGVLGTISGADFSTAFGVNDSGLIVGRSGVSTGAIHAFSDLGGIMTDLGDLGGGVSEALGVNNSGLIVGFSRLTPTGDFQAFSDFDGTMTNLNSVTDFSGSDITELESASAVNNEGQIVGYARDTAGVPVAFLLTPTNESNVPDSSESVLLVIMGLAGIAIAGRSRSSSHP